MKRKRSDYMNFVNSEYSEQCISKADVRRIPNKTYNLVKKICMIIVLLSLVCGPILYALVWRRYGFYYFGWITFGLELESFVLVVVIHLLLLSIPLLLEKGLVTICKNTSLIVTSEEVYGSYSVFVFKKTLQMPIEKVDNITVSTGIFDKLFSGKTLGISSNSGIIKFHFVQNAEEVVGSTMNHIRAIKKEKKNSSSRVTNSVATDKTVTERLKELTELKAAGFISEEEYADKKEELISSL